MGEFKKFEMPKIEFLRKIGFIYVVYFLFGAFSSRRGEGIERALQLPIYFLQKKECVLIFPEGRMVRGNELGQIRRGAGILAQRTGRPVLPVALRYRHGTYQLNIGELFEVRAHAPEPESTKKIYSALQPLYQAIYKAD